MKSAGPVNSSYFDMTRKDFLHGLAAVALAPRLTSPVYGATGQGFTEEIAPGVFVHTGVHALASPENVGNIANCSFVVGKDAVAVIDTGGSAKVGASLMAAIKATTAVPVRYVINTHMHPDHVLGNAPFKSENTAFVAHHKMARGLMARAERYLAMNKEALGPAAFEGIEIVPPNMPVESRKEIDLGGRKLILEAQKTAHTDNDLIIRDDITDTLFLGDLLFSGHIPTLDGSIKGWLTLIGSLEAQKAARAVPGHGPAHMEWPSAIAPQKHYLDAIASEVRTLIKAGKTLGEAAETVGLSEQNAWQLFQEFHKRNVSVAFAELEWE